LEEPSEVEASISVATISDIGGEDSRSDEPSDNNNEETTGLTSTSDSQSEESNGNGDDRERKGRR
jgi:hypothetical protein